jgi:hypothetical protein
METQKTDKTPTMEETKTQLPALLTLTPEGVQLKINTEVVKHKLSLPDLEKRALKVVKNEDHLQEMKSILDDLKKIEGLAEKVHESTKKPYLEGGRACDAGRKLVFGEVERIRGMFQADYARLLKGINDRAVAAAAKKARDADILAGIEANLITFSNMVVAAITKKALSEVESRINLEKSPSRVTKYGEFHAQAIARYDSALLPIIKDQKVKIEELEKINVQILEAEKANDPDKMDELIAQADVKSNEILQNHSLVQEAALNQDSFPVVEVIEVLPGVKTKRTNYSFEIHDVEVALKKVRPMLEISINKEVAKRVLDSLKAENAFEGKDFVIVDGIKYIATRTMEAL